jgi:hypothetical protein
LLGRAVPPDEEIDAKLTPLIEACFLRAQTCLEIAGLVSDREDRQRLAEMAEAWKDLGAMFLGGPGDETGSAPRAN